jgi:thioredoxin-related protein
MDDTKLKNYLELITNVAVLLVAVVTLSAFAFQLFNRAEEPRLQVGLQKGQQLDWLPLSKVPDKKQTLFIAMSTTCHHCNESVPFYNQLAVTLNRDDSQTTIVGVFPNTQDEVRDYTERQQLKIPTIAAIDLNAFRVQGTPTMILVDHTGKVLDFWVGKLSKDEEQNVIKYINPTTA